MIEVRLDNSIEQFGSSMSAQDLKEELGSKSKDVVGFICTSSNKIYDLYSHIRGPICLVPVMRNSKEHLIMKRYDLGHVISSILNEMFTVSIMNIGVNNTGLYIDFISDTHISEREFANIKESSKAYMEREHTFDIKSVSKKDALSIFDEDLSISEKIMNSDAEYVHIHNLDDFKLILDGPRSMPLNNQEVFFELLSISGLESVHTNNLQRITVTAWNTEEDLTAYLEEIKRNAQWDHRIIGKQMSMFHFNPAIASGMVFWLPNGVKVINKIKDYLRQVWVDNGYKEVITPIVMNACLWEKSGHMDMFKANMMFTKLQDNEYALKPMSCPAHINIFKADNKSYKDLPYKLCEFGLCHRYEPSGSLYGLMRARSFTQDDAHIFCSQDQIEGMILQFCQMLKTVYSHFGFDKTLVCLATRPARYIGDLASWDLAEEALSKAANKAGLELTINEGEGAFYGPKLEFSIEDKRGHVWQCGTVQVDFALCNRLDAYYTDSATERQTPVIVHHAILGSIERFLGILLENTKGLLPVWLHPHPFAILTVNQQYVDYAIELQNMLKSLCVDSYVDDTNERLAYKIRNSVENRCSYSLIIGQSEKDNRTVTCRTLDGKERIIHLEEFMKEIKDKNIIK
ncbi:MAG: threonine--tRNA ligase [Alphaproteobacteria bacterium]|nr:MAG: threonine--tRNA ligase [Alphaproteobacteria bacterium]